MNVMLLLALLAATPTARESWRNALERGDFFAAWELAAQDADPLTGPAARAEILYRAGDPAGSLAAAEAGLRDSDQDLELLHRATGAALWLEDLVAARAYSERLARAVASRETLTDEQRAAWNRAAERFEALTRELTRGSAERERAVSRARMLAIAGLIVAVGAGALCARGYGRSSSPVS